jgi:hypothetical protein
MKKSCTRAVNTTPSMAPDCNKNEDHTNIRSVSSFTWIATLIFAIFLLLRLQTAYAQQVICPCGVIVQQGQQCPCHDVYRDQDGDTYGNLANPLSIKNGDPTPNGYVTNSTDCNDADNTIHPGAPELCDGKDNNCNGIIEELYYKDFDGDGYGDPNISIINCGGQPAGYVSNKNDCNDNDPSIRQAVDWVKDSDNDRALCWQPRNVMFISGSRLCC